MNVNKEWKKISCTDYESSTNKTIFGLSEQEIRCDAISLDQNPEFEVTPDVKFRDVTRYKFSIMLNTLRSQWFIGGLDRKCLGGGAKKFFQGISLSMEKKR